MKKLVLMLFPLLAAACSEDVGVIKKADEEVSVVEDSACTVEIVDTVPVPDAIDMYYLDTLAITLSQPDASAQLTLWQNDVAVDGMMTNDGVLVGFTPTEPLVPSSSYTVQVEYCGSSEPVLYSFQTSDLGAPLDNGVNTLENKAYKVDLGFGQVIEPDVVGDILQGILENQFLIEVQEVATQEISVRIALSMANSGAQNFCVPSLENFPLLDLRAAPFFTMYSTSIPIIVAQYQMSLYDITINGTIRSDATTIEQMEARGIMDIREVFPILQDFNINVSSVDEFADQLTGLGVELLSCSDDQKYCMKIVIDSLSASQIEDPIHPVCQPNCHESCADNSETCTDPQLLLDTCPSE